ncbi:uncharacterized protein LOC124281673 [Haliotis rubra]|uniref:uncharacterized protein LOC124281673 n=1 Tax=Haliotis rubra TaxID=36100 RepID=UPI001EE5FD1D|nr:uncharacterized protein LOC124281673 [Haliotis rubra]
MTDVDNAGSCGSSRKRQPNWTKDECLLLADLVKASKQTIEGKFSQGVTATSRQETWQKITDTINSIGQQRSRDEVIKKWKNLKSAGKKNYSTFKNATTATGGGPPPTPISPVTEAVVDCIGRENTVLTGIGPMSMDSSFIQLLELDQSFEKELDPVQEGVRCPYPTSQVGQSSSASAASASLSAAASISTTSLEVLEREVSTGD